MKLEAIYALKEAVGLSGLIDVISNSGEAPANVLDWGTKEVKALLMGSDTGLPRGEVIYESVSALGAGKYSSLPAKLAVIADPLKVNVDDAILKKGERWPLLK